MAHLISTLLTFNPEENEKDTTVNWTVQSEHSQTISYLSIQIKDGSSILEKYALENCLDLNSPNVWLSIFRNEMLEFDCLKSLIPE